MKKILNLGLKTMLLCSLLFIMTGCKDNSEGKMSFDGVETTYTYGKAVYTMSVPKNDEGEAKYTFTDELSDDLDYDGSFYLETDNVIFTFDSESLAYNTSSIYKEKYGDKEATFDGYLEWIKDKDSNINLNGLEELNINDRKAIRYYISAGSSDDYTYYGYRYLVSLDNIINGSNLEMNVYYKSDEKLKSPKELDQETLDIISSLKITANK
jgi:hypothetical protein